MANRTVSNNPGNRGSQPGPQSTERESADRPQQGTDKGTVDTGPQGNPARVTDQPSDKPKPEPSDKQE